MYYLDIYDSRNTCKLDRTPYASLTHARSAAKAICKTHLFNTESFHGAPIRKGKVAVTDRNYPPIFELYEFIEGHDKNAVKTVWSN